MHAMYACAWPISTYHQSRMHTTGTNALKILTQVTPVQLRNFIHVNPLEKEGQEQEKAMAGEEGSEAVMQ
jgi:hypothetical protein